MDIPSLIENGVSPKLILGYLVRVSSFRDELSTWKLIVVVLIDSWKIIVSGGETWTDPQGGYPSGCRLTNGGIRT
jgi:hypothetical protein